jgi:NTP pyrophosphatase (non-canonical NTP hydrolase)
MMFVHAAAAKNSRSAAENRMDIEKIRQHVRKFVADRDWDQFHTPKNLAMALAGEAGELCEIFQWLSEADSRTVMNDDKRAENIKDELADVLYYVLRMADILDVDIEQAFWEKIAKSEKKYPVALARGNAKKYTEF